MLKEELADKMISIRTRDGEEAHVGKDWVVMLSADNVTKKHLFSSMLTTDVAAEVKTILAKKKK